MESSSNIFQLLLFLLLEIRSGWHRDNLDLVRVFPKRYKQTKQRSTGQLTSPPCRHINTHVYSFTPEHRTQRLAVLLSKFGFNEIHYFILITAKYFPHRHFKIQIFTYIQALSSFHLLGRIIYASPTHNSSTLPVYLQLSFSLLSMEGVWSLFLTCQVYCSI